MSTEKIAENDINEDFKENNVTEIELKENIEIEDENINDEKSLKTKSLSLSNKKEPSVTSEATNIVSPSVATTTVSELEEIELNAKLDREKLIKEFEEVFIRNRRYEWKSQILGRKVAEYFRRQKNYTAMVDENPDQIEELNRKYKKWLIDLDALFGKEKEAHIHRRITVEPIKQAIHDEQQRYTENCEVFAKRLKEVGVSLQSSSTGIPLSEEIVLSNISRMENARRIIDKERHVFIKTQDMVAEIEVEAKSLEDLGNGLRMIDFEQLRADTQSLSDKIEERNNELEKIRLRCNSDTQILAHVREKEFMLHNLIGKEKKVLRKNLSTVAEQREELYQLKLKRDSLRKTYNQMSESCGLLDKPLLLRDYDSTTNMIENQNEQIIRMEKENEQMNQEINYLVAKLNEG